MNEGNISSGDFSPTRQPSGAPSNPGGAGVETKTQQAAQSARAAVDQLKGAAREQSGAAAEQIKATAQSAARQGQEAGRSFIRGQKETLAQKVDEYAGAVRGISDRLQGEEGNVLAGPAERAAEQLGQISSYLREKEPADLLDDLEVFARRRPELVFGGLFVAGLAAARFLKASRRRVPQQPHEPVGGLAQSAASRPVPPPSSVTAAQTGVPSGAGTDDPFFTTTPAAASGTTFPTL